LSYNNIYNLEILVVPVTRSGVAFSYRPLRPKSNFQRAPLIRWHLMVASHQLLI